MTAGVPPAPPVWNPPALRPAPDDPRLVRGALQGTLLFERPEHAADKAALDAFVARGRRLHVEVGFDHGMCLLDHARRFPDDDWLGVEIRERRVAAVRPHAPDNCLPWRGDARTLFAALLPAGRVASCTVLFPDPVWVEARRARYLLFSPSFVAAVARALAPGGVLHLATDVEGYFRYAEELLDGWRAAADPPSGPVLSRRERVCRRDGLPVWRGSWAPPGGPPAPSR